MHDWRPWYPFFFHLVANKPMVQTGQLSIWYGRGSDHLYHRLCWLVHVIPIQGAQWLFCCLVEVARWVHQCTSAVLFKFNDTIRRGVPPLSRWFFLRYMQYGKRWSKLTSNACFMVLLSMLFWWDAKGCSRYLVFLLHHMYTIPCIQFQQLLSLSSSMT